MYEAVVVGAGPGGLAAVSSLLDADLSNILWIDRDFNGGRLNSLYREISSNTKVGIYLDAIASSRTCRAIIDRTPKPNPVTRFEQIDRDETCQLSLAGDMVMMLVNGLADMGVEKRIGEVSGATLEDNTWSVELLGDDRLIRTPRFVLATGSHPTPASFHEEYNSDLKVLDLDSCMVKSSLPDHLPSDRRSRVALIGNSHSGVLVCRNLYEISTQASSTSSSRSNSDHLTSNHGSDNGIVGEKEQSRDVSIVNFQRSPIRYADYRSDGIVYDNTGLKGSTADWAKATMENRSNDEAITQIRLKDGKEKETYREYLPQCTHIIYAIGYTPSPTPALFIVDGKGKRRIDQDIEFDMHSSGFRLRQQRKTTVNGSRDAGHERDELNDGETVGPSSEEKNLSGLFGCGIAFPEEVADPEGHVEAAVGLAKFFKFAGRVKDNWAKKSI